MTAATISTRSKETSNHARKTGIAKSIENIQEILHEKMVDVEPVPDGWKAIAAGTLTPIALAGAAAFATYISKNERVAMTAWIAVAVVGSASVISAASASHRRIVRIKSPESKSMTPSKTRGAKADCE